MQVTDLRRFVAVILAVACAAAPVSPAAAQSITYPSTCYDQCGEPTIDVGNRPVRAQVTVGGRYEYVVIGPLAESGAAAVAIAEAGGTVIRGADLTALGQGSLIATFPGAAAYDAALGALARVAPGSSLAPNHLYGFAQSTGRVPRVYAPTLIGDPAPGRCRLTRPLVIGMIDGPVNTAHPALRGAEVVHESLVPGGPVPDADHGTAVAALLVGDDETGALAGFARGARLHAISVFVDREEGEEASVDRIAGAIDRLLQGGARLINLSIAGPENPALARALAAAAGRGAVLVAASGNGQRRQVAWPAASEHVIAVTAVDAARRRFRMANTGAEIEFAAPGVDVYAARQRGAGYVSGTSFAAPIVTALAARLMAGGTTSAEGVRARLRAGAEPLGSAAGARNAEFGYGLARADGC